MDGIRPIVERAGALYGSYEKILREIRERQIRAFTDFRKEDMLGAGFTPEVERAAGKADHDEQVARKEFLDQLSVLEKEASAILTSGQRRLLNSQAEMTDAAQRYLTGRPPKTRSLPARVSIVVRKIRALSEEEYRSRRDGLRRDLERALGWNPEKDADPKAYSGRMKKAMDEIRKLADDEATDRVLDILEDASPRSEGERIRGELGEIHKVKYGAAGRLGYFLASPVTARLMDAKFGRKADGPYSPAASDDQGKEEEQIEIRIQRLRGEINLLNLSNGMYFTKHQMEHIARAAGEAAEITGLAGCDSAMLEEYRKILLRLWEDMEAGRDVSDEDGKSLLRLARKIHDPGAPASGKRPAKTIDTLCREVEAVLFAGQKAVLVDYKACLIPPKNLKDPVRVGQSEDYSGAVRYLERMRRYPEKRWRQRREKLIDDALDQVEKAQGEYTGEELAKKKEWLLDLCERVRKLSDADFELEKQGLAKELSTIDRKETLEERLKKLSGDAAIVRQKIRAFLLDPVMADVLKARLKLLKEKPDLKCVNLDDISPAPSCKDGGCAVKEK